MDGCRAPKRQRLPALTEAGAASLVLPTRHLLGLLLIQRSDLTWLRKTLEDMKRLDFPIDPSMSLKGFLLAVRGNVGLVTVRRLASFEGGTSVRREGVGIGQFDTHQLSDVLDSPPDDAQWAQAEAELAARMLEGSVRHVSACEVRYTITRLAQLQRCHHILERHRRKQQQQLQARSDGVSASIQEAEAEQQLRDELYDTLSGYLWADGMWAVVRQRLQAWSPEAAGTLLAAALTQRSVPSAPPPQAQPQSESPPPPQRQAQHNHDPNPLAARRMGTLLEAHTQLAPLPPQSQAQPDRGASSTQPLVLMAAAAAVPCAPTALPPPTSPRTALSHQAPPPQQQQQLQPPQQQQMPLPPPQNQLLPPPPQQQQVSSRAAPPQLPVKDEDMGVAEPVGLAGPSPAPGLHCPALVPAPGPAPAPGRFPGPELAPVASQQARSSADGDGNSPRDLHPHPPAPHIKAEPAPRQASPPAVASYATTHTTCQSSVPSAAPNLSALAEADPAFAAPPARRGVFDLPSYLQPRPRQAPSTDPRVGAVAASDAAAPAAPADLARESAAAAICAAAVSAKAPASSQAAISIAHRASAANNAAPAPVARSTVPVPPAAVPLPRLDAAAAVAPALPHSASNVTGAVPPPQMSSCTAPRAPGSDVTKSDPIRDPQGTCGPVDGKSDTTAAPAVAAAAVTTRQQDPPGRDHQLLGEQRHARPQQPQAQRQRQEDASRGLRGHLLAQPKQRPQPSLQDQPYEREQLSPKQQQPSRAAQSLLSAPSAAPLPSSMRPSEQTQATAGISSALPRTLSASSQQLGASAATAAAQPPPAGLPQQAAIPPAAYGVRLTHGTLTAAAGPVGDLTAPGSQTSRPSAATAALTAPAVPRPRDAAAQPTSIEVVRSSDGASGAGAKPAARNAQVDQNTGASAQSRSAAAAPAVGTAIGEPTGLRRQNSFAANANAASYARLPHKPPPPAVPDSVSSQPAVSAPEEHHPRLDNAAAVPPAGAVDAGHPSAAASKGATGAAVAPAAAAALPATATAAAAAPPPSATAPPRPSFKLPVCAPAAAAAAAGPPPAPAPAPPSLPSPRSTHIVSGGMGLGVSFNLLSMLANNAGDTTRRHSALSECQGRPGEASASGPLSPSRAAPATAAATPSVPAADASTATAAGPVAGADPHASRRELLQRMSAELAELRARAAAKQAAELQQQQEAQRLQFLQEQQRQQQLQHWRQQEVQFEMHQRLQQRCGQGGWAAAGTASCGSPRTHMDAAAAGGDVGAEADYSEPYGGNDDGADDGGEEMEMDSPQAGASRGGSAGGGKRGGARGKPPRKLAWARRVRAFLRKQPKRRATYGDVVRAGLGLPEFVVQPDNYHAIIKYLGQPFMKGFFRVVRSMKKGTDEFCVLEAVGSANGKGLARGAEAACGGGGGSAPSGWSAGGIATDNVQGSSLGSGDDGGGTVVSIGGISNMAAGAASANGGVGDAVSAARGGDVSPVPGAVAAAHGAEDELSYLRRLYDHLVQHPDGLTLGALAGSPVRVPAHLLNCSVRKWVAAHKKHWCFRGPLLVAKPGKRP